MACKLEGCEMNCEDSNVRCGEDLKVSNDLDAIVAKVNPKEVTTNRQGRVNTLAWLATFIKLYTILMPMKNELRTSDP